MNFSRAIGLIGLGLLLSMQPGCLANRILLGANQRQFDAHGARREVIPIADRQVECWVQRSPGAQIQPTTTAITHTDGPQSKTGTSPSSQSTSRPSPPGPAAFVLFFPGAGSRAEPWVGGIALAWADRPVEIWGMNYPASGGTAGPMSLRLVVPDALTVYDEVRKRAGDRPIFIQASSFGTSVGLAVAARRPVAGMILKNPPPLRQLILTRHGWWNLWLLAVPTALSIPNDLDSIANARRNNAPAIFVEAMADETVPPKFQDWVIGSYSGPKELIRIPGGMHKSPLPKEAAEELERHTQVAVGGEWTVTGFA